MATVIEKPMLFSAPMVRAILEGRKTQTRRVVNLSRVSHPVNGMWFQRPEEVWVAADIDAGNFDPPECWGQTEIKCPHSVGSRIWVRETWRLVIINGVMAGGAEFATIQFRSGYGVLPYRVDWQTHYMGLRNTERYWDSGQIGDIYGSWRPSIHMPRWASRITLEVTDVRVQRLQEIDGMDAKAEGVSIPAHIPHDGADMDWARREFKALWNSINGPDAWEQNPWVWAYTFRRLEGDHE